MTAVTTRDGGDGLAPAERATLTRRRATRRAEATERAYRSHRLAWAKWATARGCRVFPAEPVYVALWLDARAAAGRRPATIAAGLTALAAEHRERGAPSPAEHDDVRATLASIRRAPGAGDTRQAAALDADALAAIRGATRAEVRAGRLDAATAARDWAIVLTMHDAGLRRSEAAALRWADVGADTLTVRRSKTDQGGSGRLLRLTPRAAAALAAIRPLDADGEARVFRLRSGRSIARRVQAAGARAGLALSGHSPRVGMAHDLAAAGESDRAIGDAGRWRSGAMVAHYTARANTRRGAAARVFG